MEYGKLQFIINYITKKKMSKPSELEQQIEQLTKDKKKLANALKHSNDNLITLKKQLFLTEEHFVSENIKANEKILENLKHG